MRPVRFFWLALVCAAFLAVAAFLGWSVKGLLGRDDSPTPMRPANVAASALWAGGPDGGVWIDCVKSAGRLFQCGIYAQYNGALVEQGQFELDTGAVRPAFYSNGLIALKEARLVRSP